MIKRRVLNLASPPCTPIPPPPPPFASFTSALKIYYTVGKGKQVVFVTMGLLIRSRYVSKTIYHYRFFMLRPVWDDSVCVRAPSVPAPLFRRRRLAIR